MILEIRLQNFYSINEEVILDLRAGNIKNKNAQNLKNNIFETEKDKFLKTVAIYGANASGKSNIIKAIRWCCRFILDSHQFNQNVEFNIKPFKFHTEEKPSIFLIRFIFESIEYEYSFAVNLYQHTIAKESLYYYPKGRKVKIFDRDESQGSSKKDQYTFGQMIKRPFDVAENTSNKNLYLSRASQMDREFAKQIYNYFYQQFILQYYDNRTDNIELFLRDEEAKKFLLKSLQVADSDIIDIDFEKQQVNAIGFHIEVDDQSESVTGQKKEKIEEFIRIKTFHKAKPRIVFDFGHEESEGTKKLFFVLLNIFDIIQNGKILLIDEIETSLHPKIVEYIIDLFYQSHQSQLIFSTHNTNLLDLKKLRKDQIYFVNKKFDGSSDLYSLYDYKDFRETMDLEKAYLQGRFDAIPLIESE